jgi:hypothetical protein
MAEDEPVDQITDLLCGVYNLCLDALYTWYTDLVATNSYRYKEIRKAWLKVVNIHVFSCYITPRLCVR